MQSTFNKSSSETKASTQQTDSSGVASVSTGNSLFNSCLALRKTSDVSKKIFKAFSKGDYTEIQMLIESGFFSTSEIQSYFKKEGHLLLGRALICEDIKPLEFLVKYIPQDIFKNLLEDDDYSLLKSLINTHLLGVKLNLNITSEEDFLFRKLNVLLSTESADRAGVTHVIEEFAYNAQVPGEISKKLQCLITQYQSISAKP